jgi:amino acid transporter
MAIGMCSLFGLMSYMAVSSSSGRVFGWFANMTSIAGIFAIFFCESLHKFAEPTT